MQSFVADLMQGQARHRGLLAAVGTIALPRDQGALTVLACKDLDGRGIDEDLERKSLNSAHCSSIRQYIVR
jgi:hypothetical protein